MTYSSKPAHATAAWNVRYSISRAISVMLPVALSIALLPLFTANVAIASESRLAAAQIDQSAVSDIVDQSAIVEQAGEISAQVAEQVEADPHAPGLVDVEVGNSAYALREADPGNDQADGQQGVVDDVSRRELKELLHIEEMIFSRDRDLM